MNNGEYTQPAARTLGESAADGVVRVLCVTGAEFEDDYAEQRAWASREGDDAVAEETEKDRARADGFRFPVYSNIEFPASAEGWFHDPDQFEAHRGEIEEIALPAWNDLNGFRFVKAVSLEFEDATDDVLCEGGDPVAAYLDGLGESEKDPVAAYLDGLDEEAAFRR